MHETETSPPLHASLTDQRILDLILTDPTAWEIWSAGFCSGHTAGFAAAEFDQVQRAELAARKFYAMEGWEVDNRRRTELDRQWPDVLRARAGQRKVVAS